MKKLAELPDNYFISSMNLDVVPSYVVANETPISKDELFELPNSLSHFLNNHWGGTKELRETIRKEVQAEIRQILNLP